MSDSLFNSPIGEGRYRADCDIRSLIETINKEQELDINKKKFSIEKGFSKEKFNSDGEMIKYYLSILKSKKIKVKCKYLRAIKNRRHASYLLTLSIDKKDVEDLKNGEILKSLKG